MKGESPIIRRDLLNRYGSLKRRIAKLLDGATPMRFYVGAYGLNTTWIKLTPKEGWHYVGGSHIFVRLRSDTVYFYTEGNGGVTPVSATTWPTGPVFQLPGKPHVFWPSYRVKTHCISTLGSYCLMTVKPSGLIYPGEPISGRILKFGSASFPRG